MTPQEVIDEARILIGDDNPDMPHRFSDADLLGYVNQAMKRAAIVRPDLFIVSGEITLVADNVSQDAGEAVQRLMEIHRVVDGPAILEADKETMDRSYPAWVSETPGTPVNWMRHPRNPRRFFLYPAPDADVRIEGEVIQVPDNYEVDDDIALPETYKPALIDCIVGLAEYVDNESADNGRAEKFFSSFMQALGADMAQRTLVDHEDGNVGREPRGRPAQGGQP